MPVGHYMELNARADAEDDEVIRLCNISLGHTTTSQHLTPCLEVNTWFDDCMSIQEAMGHNSLTCIFANAM